MERLTHQLDLKSVAETSVRIRRAQAIVETTSVLTESHHQPDVYYYRVKDERLFSSTAKKFVEDVTTEGSDLKVLKELQTWSNINEKGTAIWISPPIDDDHPSTKITVSEIKTGSYIKQIKNTAQLIDIDSPTDLANALLGYSINPLESVTSENELREKLIIVKDVDEAWALISQYIDQKNAWKIYKEFVQTSNDIYTENRRDRVAYSRAITSHAGNFRLGCNTVSSIPVFGFSFSGVLGYQSVEYTSVSGESKWVENCGQCGVEIRAVIKKGYECNRCHGVYQGC